MTVYEIINEKIINRLLEAKENGVKFHWIKPWSGGTNCPLSYSTGKAYTGINRLILENSEFITFKALMDYKKTQPEDAPIFIRKGARKLPVFFYGTYEKEDAEGNVIIDENGNIQKGHYLKFYQVFDREDIEGLPSHFPAKKVVKTTTVSTQKLQEYIDAYARSEKISIEYIEDGSRCYFSPSDHRIRVPKSEGFTSLYAFYNSLAHEIGHSTIMGLNRKTGKSFGSKDYSREELVAQIFAEIVCNHFEIAYDEKESENDLAYIDNWLNVLKARDNTKELTIAAGQAEKAFQYFIEKAESNLSTSKAA
ncbi:MAG: DUF1738 domain-containing protein [Ruminococcus sp.]|nr:DUF1738 domain-containing protein [Ruminococcus sp.]